MTRSCSYSRAIVRYRAAALARSRDDETRGFGSEHFRVTCEIHYLKAPVRPRSDDGMRWTLTV